MPTVNNHRWVIRRRDNGFYLRKDRWRLTWVSEIQQADVWRGKGFVNRYAKRPEYEVIEVTIVRVLRADGEF